MYLPINNFPMWAYRINMKEIIEKSLTVKKTKSMISLFWEISAGSYPLLITDDYVNIIEFRTISMFKLNI
jgi:hypothetical protein